MTVVGMILQNLKGGTQQPYSYLSEVFLPKLRKAGLDQAMIDQLTRVNPFNAFAR